MIYDKFENMETYFQPSEPVYDAICFAVEKAATLPDGDHELTCGGIVARVMAYVTEPAQQRLFATINLQPGWFAVYFPQDNHRPNCSVGESESVRKVCMKIPV